MKKSAMRRSASEPARLDEQPESTAAALPGGRHYGEVHLRRHPPSTSSPSTPDTGSSGSSSKRKLENTSSQRPQRAKKSADAPLSTSLADDGDKLVQVLLTAVGALVNYSPPPGSSPAARPSPSRPPLSPSSITPTKQRANHLARSLAQQGAGHTEALQLLLAVLQAYKALDAQRLGLSKATRESLLEKYSFLQEPVDQLEAVVQSRGPAATLTGKAVPDPLCQTFLETALKQLYLIQQIISKEGGERALYMPTLAVVRPMLQASAGAMTISVTGNHSEDAPAGAAAQAEVLTVQPSTPTARPPTDEAQVQQPEEEPSTPPAAQPTDESDVQQPAAEPSQITVAACEALFMILYEAELRGRHFGGYCEFLVKEVATKLLHAVMEVKQESTFSGGVCQLFAQLMSAFEHNLEENLYQEPDAEMCMHGILTDLGRWLFVRLTASRDPNHPARISNVRMEHSGVLMLLQPDLTKPHPLESLEVMRLLCTILVPEACEWSQQVWLDHLQAAAVNAEDRARLAAASTVVAQLAAEKAKAAAQLEAKDAELAASRAETAAANEKLAAMQKQLDEFTMAKQ